jgi:hypothetical protein
MMKTFWYLLFLVALGVWTYGTYRLMKPKSDETKLSFRDLEAQYLLGSLMLYVFVLLLARFSTLLIASVYFLSAQFDILLKVMSGETAHRRNPSRYLAERLWAATCFSVRHPILTYTTIFMSMVILIGYPVVAGIVYFSSTIPSSAATLSIIRVTLLLLFIGGTALTLPIQIGAALSENLSSPARRRFLASSLATIAPQSVILTTFLWTFSSVENKASHSTLVFRFTYSPTVLAILAAYFVITLLLPYLIGIGRCSHQHDLLESRKKDALTETIHLLRIPLADSYVPELSRLATDLRNQYEDFARNDISIQLGMHFGEIYKEDELLAEADSPPSSPPIEAAKDHPGSGTLSVVDLSVKPLPPRERTNKAPLNPTYPFDPDIYHLARPEDPRFRYLDWLDSHVKRLDMTASDLQAKSASAIRVRAARAWADSYDGDRRDLSENASETKTHALTAIVASTAITTVASVFFTGFGNWLWTHAAQNLPK